MNGANNGNWMGIWRACRLLNFVYDAPADPAAEKLVVQYLYGDVCYSSNLGLPRLEKSKDDMGAEMIPALAARRYMESTTERQDLVRARSTASSPLLV